MPRTRTLAELRTEVRQRAEMEDSEFCTDLEVNRYLNQSIAKLFGKLVRARGDQYYAVKTTLATVAGNESVALPSNFLRLLRVQTTVQGELVHVRRGELSDLERWGTERGHPQRYLVEAGNLTILPIPDAVYSLAVRYVPHATVLVADDDTFDGVNGWEHYVVLDTAIAMVGKEESSRIPEMIAERAEIERLIDELANDRDDGAPPTVQDVRRPDLASWPYRRRYYP